jgi:hypothetical protein
MVSKGVEERRPLPNVISDPPQWLVGLYVVREAVAEDGDR